MMVFQRSLSDSQSRQVTRTPLSILAEVINAVVLMITSCPLILKSSSHIIHPLGIVPSASIKIGINVSLMIHGFFLSLAKSRYSSFFSPSFDFALWFAGTAKSTIP